MSGPAWSSILTGQSQSVHCVLDNDLGNKAGRLPALPTVLSLVKEVQSRISPSIQPSSVAVVSGDWDGMPILCKRDADILEWFKDCTKPEIACDFATRLLEQATSPDILFVYLDLIDHTGHDKGFGLHVPEYISAIEQVDAALAPLLQAVRRREQQCGEDWLVLVTTDHGGSDVQCHDKRVLRHFAENWGASGFEYQGVHGMNLPQHRGTFFIASRRNRTGREVIPAPRAEDVAVTLLSHFSKAAARNWQFAGVAQGEHLDPLPTTTATTTTQAEEQEHSFAAQGTNWTVRAQSKL